MKNAINFLLFQIGWFACALGAGGGLPSLGVGVVGAILIFHFWKMTSSFQELFLLLKVVGVGFVVDTILASMGAIDFGKNAIWGPLSPPFMMALWLNFAMTLNHSMSWLQGKYWLGLAFGAIGGALAYYAGAKLGALQLSSNTLFALGAIGLLWGVSMLGILYFLLKNPRQENNGNPSIVHSHF